MKQLDAYYAKTTPEQRSSAAIAFLAAIDHIEESTPSVSDKILQELVDQRASLKMIASENYSSLAVQLAMGNLLTDKYAEGIPHHRFYAGCENVDSLESEAVGYLRDIFGCDHAYVQPHSGADANLVAFFAILIKRVQAKEIERLGKRTLDELTPEEYEMVRQHLVNQKILGMSLNSGGHLTHGYRHNLSSKVMQAFYYDVDPATGLLDYAQIAKIAKEQKPAILLAGYSAYPRKINFAKMKEIADSVGATFVVDMAHFAGLVAGKVFTGEYNPVAYADVITSTTHKTLRGPRGGFVLCTNEYKEYVDKGCPLVLGGPLPHVIAAKCVAFKEAKDASFQKYAQKIVQNSQALAKALIKLGFRVLTGGTENHMVLVDVSPFNLTGRHAENALRQAHITCNRNAIPFDKNGPWYTSGIRLGTPALTTLGMGEQEMEKIASIIHKCLTHTTPLPSPQGGISRALCQVAPDVLASLQAETKELLGRYPLYPEIEICQEQCVPQ